MGEAARGLGRSLVDVGEIDTARPLLEKIDASQDEYSDAQAILSVLKLL